MLATDLFDRMASYVTDLQDRICSAVEDLDGEASFVSRRWERPGGGGGDTRVLQDGSIFEKAGVNTSKVSGTVPNALAGELAGSGDTFRATGVSLIIHPRSPMVPTVHANFRRIERGDGGWFGGGADLTPSYVAEEDCVDFHGVWRDVCAAHPGVADYPAWKKWCDRYFWLAHRNEARGIGGIFFDDLSPGDDEAAFAFVRDAGDAFIDSYLPIVRRRMDEPWEDEERRFQLLRRGRYVEFNLIYDRGTKFGLRTAGNIESILVSMPALAAWEYDWEPPAGSREEAAMKVFRAPRDWV